ncbi:hypothetical protein PENSPDRAFT_751066 [Peniophora sp. CONT]|nr:hypothetical protein PENSPDRAFT_751066 [Peniophora sp. CONT]
MTFPSPDNVGALKSLMERDAVFRDKLDTATSLAETLGKEAISEIYAAQLSLQRLSEGGYPPEMAEVIKNKARKTIKRHSKFLSAMSSLKEPRLGRSYGPGESPVHALPSEMLSVIFALAAQYPSLIGEKYCTPNTLRLVCRHWKEVAEETPTLWRNMDFTGSLEWIRRAVYWSKSVSLDVSISLLALGRAPAQFMEGARFVLAELPRIRTLDISTYSDTAPRKIVTELLLSRPAPLLTEFKFASENMSDSVDTFRPDIFTGEVPTQLRVLTVYRMQIHVSCPVFRAPLTNLTLEFCTIWTTADQLLHTLAELPLLEHLVLRTMRNVIPPVDGSAVYDFVRKGVKLPNLQTLHVRDDIEVLLAVFSHLDIPNATEVTIAADYDNINLFAQSNVLAEINDVFGSYIVNAFGDNVTVPDAFTSLAITSFPAAYATGYSAVFSDPAVYRNGLTHFSLGFNVDSDFEGDYVDEFRTPFMRTLSWTPMNYRISRLVAIKDLGVLRSDATWMQIFDCLQGLEEVHVGSRSVPYFIRSLSACNPDAVRSLRKLVFDQATFDDTIIDALAALLSARQGLGNPPLMLSFVTCSITSEALDKLEGASGVCEVYVHVDPRKTPRVGDADVTSKSV